MVLALLAGSAGAAEIEGKAVDSSGGVLVGASVALENVATGAVSRTTTGQDGRYAFTVGRGLFRLTASREGFSQETRNLSIAGDEASREVELVLQVGNLTTEISVTASRSARDSHLVPLRAEGLVEEDRRDLNPASTGEFMLRLPGVTPVGTGSFQVRPRLRGLDSSRILVLVDGERLNNARIATDRAGVEVGLVDVSSAHGIEAVSGSGSVLYGTDALAGTINILTTQPKVSEQLRLDAGLDGYYSSNENGRRGTLSLGLSGPRFALRMLGSLEAFDDYRAGSDFSEDSSLAMHEAGALAQADTVDDAFGFEFGAFPDPFNQPFQRTSSRIGQSSWEGDNLNVTGLVSVSSTQTLRVKYLRRQASDVGFPDFEAPFFFQEIVLPFSNLDKVSGTYEVREVAGPLTSLRATAYWQRTNRRLSNRNIPVQFPAPTRGSFFPINVFRLNVDSDTEQDIRTLGLDVQATLLLSHTHVLTGGLTSYRDRSHDDRFSSTSQFLVGTVALGPRGPQANVLPEPMALGPASLSHPVRVPDASFRDVGVFLQDEWDVAEKLRLTAGARLDFYNVTSDATSGYDSAPLVAGAEPAIQASTLPDQDGARLSRRAFTGDLGLVFRPGEQWSLVAHYGRSYRHPNLEELLFAGPATIGSIIPNLRVGPETGHNLDLGVKLRSGRVAASLTFFHNRYADFISTEIVADSPRGLLSRAVNFSRVRIQGVEADVEAPVSVGGGLISFFGAAAYNHGQVLEGTSPLTEESLADTPQDNITPFKAITGVRVSDRKGRLWAEYSNRIQSEVRRVAVTLERSPYLIAQDLFSLEGLVLHRLAGGVRWDGEDLELGLTVAVENLTDEFYREQFQFAPARGRSLTLGLHVGTR